MYSMTTTLSGRWEGFFTLGQGLLRVVGDIHGVQVADEDVQKIGRAMRTTPAHPYVEEGLTAGFRLMTLTNSPAGRALEHAGLASFFERQFTVETIRAYKSDPRAYTASRVRMLVASSLTRGCGFGRCGAQPGHFVEASLRSNQSSPAACSRVPISRMDRPQAAANKRPSQSRERRRSHTVPERPE